MCASPSKAAPQGRGHTPVAPPVTAASPLLPRSGSSLAQCVNASPAGRPGRGLLAVPISPGHSGARSGEVRPHLRDLPFHGTRRLPLRTPEHPPQRLQAPMQSRPLRSRSFKRAPCSAPVNVGSQYKGVKGNKQDLAQLIRKPEKAANPVSVWARASGSDLMSRI
ncbi:hypothetical protein NDU88_003507 [Pleurodeles waltl]|uniref:Uncharacterized protein n=1 Tax=Pleurodeles waltl TaxID=8319 RepID=A0AAV7W695_PLEWA|nr:hypothetical protein NDU88_003507 [Pleurodeles waltl]